MTASLDTIGPIAGANFAVIWMSLPLGLATMMRPRVGLCEVAPSGGQYHVDDRAPAGASAGIGGGPTRVVAARPASTKRSPISPRTRATTRNATARVLMWIVRR